MEGQEKKARERAAASGNWTVQREEVDEQLPEDPEREARHLRLKTHLWERLDARESRQEASRRLGRGPTYLKDQARCSQSYRTGDIDDALLVVGYKQRDEFYYRTYEPQEVDPLAALELMRECQGLKPDPLLEEMRPRLVALVDAPATAAEPWESGEAKIRELDLLRRRNRTKATARLEVLLRDVFGRLDTYTVKPLRGIAELCLIVFVFATTYRLAGRRDDASDWLKLTWPLVKKVGGFLLRGEWFQRAAYLLVDLSYPTRALHFMKEALTCFTLVGATGKCQRALVDMAYVLTHADQHEKSRQMLEEVLPMLPESDREYRLAAHQLLAGNLRALGDLPGSRHHINEAITLVGDDALAHGSCLWCLGVWLLAEGDTKGALEKLGEAMPLVARFCGAAELAEMGMKYAGLLRQEGRRPELEKLAADLSRWIDQLKGHQRLRNMINNFQALLTLNALNDQTFQGLLAELEAAKKAMRVVAKRLRKKARGV